LGHPAVGNGEEISYVNRRVSRRARKMDNDWADVTSSIVVPRQVRWPTTGKALLATDGCQLNRR